MLNFLSPSSFFTHHRMLTSHPKKPLNDTMCFTCPIHSLLLFMFWREYAASSNLFFSVLCSLNMQFYCSWILFRPSVPPGFFCLIQFWTWQQCFFASMRILLFLSFLCFQLLDFFLCLCFPPVHHLPAKKILKGANECVYEFSAE